MSATETAAFPASHTTNMQISNLGGSVECAHHKASKQYVTRQHSHVVISNRWQKHGVREASFGAHIEIYYRNPACNQVLHL